MKPSDHEDWWAPFAGFWWSKQTSSPSWFRLLSLALVVIGALLSAVLNAPWWGFVCVLLLLPVVQLSVLRARQNLSR